MTKPNEKEQVDEELSTDELKGVSGGFQQMVGDSAVGVVSNPKLGVKGNSPDNPQGSGYGGTLEDWKKRTQSGEGKFFDLGGDI